MGDERASPLNAGRTTASGPLIVQGRIRQLGPDGASAAEYTQAVLCRCGGSGNEPFCEGTHGKTGFVA